MKRILAILALSLLSTLAMARPLKIQIPFAPGFWGDIHARSLADYLSRNGHETVVINAQGGGSNVALDAAANDKDTTVITQAGAGFMALYQTYKNSPTAFDQIETVFPVGNNHWILYSAPGVKFTGPQSFNKTAFASSGVGSASHVFFSMINKHYNADMVHIPYKGSSAAALDVAAGRVSFMMDPATNQEKLNALGIQNVCVLLDKRSPLFPNIPTAKEIGIDTLTGQYSMTNLYYVVGSNFDPALKKELAVLIDRHNRQWSAVEYERKFGVGQPDSKTPDQYDRILKAHSTKFVELQTQFIK